ncbi:Ubiquitin-protein ligase [Pseudozyma hubeiensis]|nr:Ubiquitin-protein ligase [Pseudozyma hubeiensis]
MKYFALSMVSALALASLGSQVASRPLPQTQSDTQNQRYAQQAPSSGSDASQTGSAGGYGGTASATQNNDYSQVAPGNQVMNGGGQSASLQGLAGTVMQGANVGSLLQRRQSDGQSGQQASAGGYAGTSSAYQNNDYSGVAPGNSVELGGSQSASDQGTSGTIDQTSNGGQVRQRSLPNDPTQLLSVFQDGVPSEIVARSDDNGIYIASTKFGPPTTSANEQHPVACAQGGEHCIPHYEGLGPEERPSPQVG